MDDAIAYTKKVKASNVPSFSLNLTQDFETVIGLDSPTYIMVQKHKEKLYKVWTELKLQLRMRKGLTL